MTKGWKIQEHRAAQKKIARAPKQVRTKYEFWKEQIIDFGPPAIRVDRFPGFKDHALTGDWKGYRSSYLNDQYRVIYRIEKQDVMVTVEKIGPHDY